ncbi:hypothetical protein BJ741DRAFT_630958 [Chytriomyces cf. hyalinus JEL632]|nr:hypothetical protein BJ741DRAFT_630958 [Chytriomyces cf. hyalinus JEL632]
MGVAVTGASWYVSRLARSQDVVWNRRNQSPFLDVPQGFTVKVRSTFLRLPFAIFLSHT